MDKRLNGRSWFRVRETFLDQSSFDSRADAYSAIRKLVPSLDDPFTRFLEPVRLQRLRSDTQRSSVTGVGVELSLTQGSGQANSQLKVVTPAEGGPSERAGVRPGDVITAAVDDKPTAGISLYEASDLLQGPPGTPVTLTVRSPGKDGKLGPERELPIVREVIVIKPVSAASCSGVNTAALGLPAPKEAAAGSGRVEYIRVSTFNASTVEGVVAAIKEAKSTGAEGIVLDLRNNPGGLFPAGVEVAKLLLAGGDVVLIADSAGVRDIVSADAGALALDTRTPLSVWVNMGTASASEVLAGALKDNGRAVVMDDGTFGKASSSAGPHRSPHPHPAQDVPPPAAPAVAPAAPRTTIITIQLRSEDELQPARLALTVAYIRLALEVRAVGLHLGMVTVPSACDARILELLGEQAQEPHVLQFYACEKLWDPIAPSFPTVVGRAKPLLVEHFGDALSTLNTPRLREQLLALPAAGLEALLEADAFGTDSEDTVLLLLAEWMLANWESTEAAWRKRLCGLVRLVQLPGSCLAPGGSAAGVEFPAGLDCQLSVRCGEGGIEMKPHHDDDDCYIVGERHKERLPAHKLALALASPMFRAQLERWNGADLRPGRPELLVSLDSEAELPAAICALQYAYTGLLAVASMPEALQVAQMGEYLVIEGCSAACMKWVADRLLAERSTAASGPTFLELYSCDDLSTCTAPGLQAILDRTKPQLLGHFGNSLAVLNTPCLREQLLDLSAAGLESLLESDAFGTDSEASILHLLAVWMEANFSRTDLAMRKRLCGLVRLAQLGPDSRASVLGPLAHDFMATGGSTPPGWFPVTAAEASHVSYFASINPLLRSSLCKAAAGAWYSTTPRTHCIPQAGLEAEWSISREQLHGAHTAVANGLEWSVQVELESGADAASVRFTWSLPAAFKLPGSCLAPGGSAAGLPYHGELWCVLTVHRSDPAQGVSFMQVFGGTFGRGSSVELGEGSIMLGALPLAKPPPEADALLGPWAGYLGPEGKLTGSLKVLPHS
ncbi:hypothetical protein HYH03_017729 [Edaphochlamys debaryana]|uniref:PDZ domain-containing protein n=1 Tax=Edaphochlamys debaryana TaxID=47281 RepID=A0A836BQ94_9CHLO|nr:hypothetical protein HYH03_017729 [Edaphochlamys debaryana]|eukprot:KAG2483373.1 hypothetical protein HYH03_017729 [Edaphochlamys debaryana]